MRNYPKYQDPGHPTLHLNQLWIKTRTVLCAPPLLLRTILMPARKENFWESELTRKVIPYSSGKPDLNDQQVKGALTSFNVFVLVHPKRSLSKRGCASVINNRRQSSTQNRFVFTLKFQELNIETKSHWRAEINEASTKRYTVQSTSFEDQKWNIFAYKRTYLAVMFFVLLQKVNTMIG